MSPSFSGRATPLGNSASAYVEGFCQGKGIGRLLFNQALLHAKRRKLTTLHVQYLRRNGRMASLCRALTTIFEQDGEETACSIKIADTDPAEACRYEVIDGLEIFHGDAHEARAHVLLIHGVAGDGWQWRENFLPYFSGHGFSSRAFSLRGHGGSEIREDLTLRGYEEDVKAILRGLGEQPITAHRIITFSPTKAIFCPR